MILENVNRNKLHQELADAGVLCNVFALNNTQIGAEISFGDGTDMDLVQQIIDAHDPTPIPSKPSELDILKTKLNSAMQQLDFQEELIVELAMKVYE